MGPYHSSATSIHHNDIFASLAGLDEETSYDNFLTSSPSRRGVSRNPITPRWTLSQDGPTRNSGVSPHYYSNEVSGAFGQCLNPLAMVEPVVDSDGYPEPVIQANETEDLEDVVFSTDWRVSTLCFINNRLLSLSILTAT